MSEPTITFDLAVTEWPGPKRVIYQKTVGSHPMYAMLLIEQTLEQASEESDAYAGADEDWFPPSLFNLPEREVAGFAWMAARTVQPGLKFADYFRSLDYAEMVTALLQMVMAAAGVDESEGPDAPLVTDAAAGDATSKTGPPSASASFAAPSTAGRRTSAARSRSTTSKPRTAARKSSSKP